MTPGEQLDPPGTDWRRQLNSAAMPERELPRAESCGARRITGHCFTLPCDDGCSDGGCCSSTCRCTFCTADERELAGRRLHLPATS